MRATSDPAEGSEIARQMRLSPLTTAAGSIENGHQCNVENGSKMQRQKWS
jgi:hypothetical protein